MGVLLVHLPNLAGARRPSPARFQWDRGAWLSVSAVAPGGPMKEKGTRRKERIVIRVSDPVRERRLPSPLFTSPDSLSDPPAARRRQGEEDGEEERRRYYVNIGDAIRTLWEELLAAISILRSPELNK
uniref:Uncharacterized protein n=1 Tax=Leersia perrieri TaxID=77586 RepID=A0A0D9WDZ6_9ORYZ